jgi:hypothetical protein
MNREQWNRVFDVLAAADPGSIPAYKRYYRMRCDLWVRNQTKELEDVEKLRWLMWARHWGKRIV